MKRFLCIAIVIAVLACPAAPVRAEFSRDLAFGSEGARVTELQQFLKDQQIYGGPVSGRFLSLTQTAVRAFQIRENITPATGYFGPKSRGRANALLQTRAAAAAAPGTTLTLTEQIRRLEEQLQALQKLAAGTSTTSSTPPAAAAPASPETLIEARSIVGLTCLFNGPDGQSMETRGSGVIITPDGVILTVRHLVDLGYSRSVDPKSITAEIAQSFSLDHCDVGQVSAGSILSSPEIIRSLNPFIPVPGLFYRAAVSYLPVPAGVSAGEMERLDFALLKISGLSAAGAMTVGVSLPARFEYSLLERTGAPAENSPVLTYGYPGDVTRGLGQQFAQLYLVGSAGRVKAVYSGDAFFINQPLVINTEMEVRSGRSGSPLFVNGKVVGIISSHAADNVANSFSVSSGAVYRLISSLLPNLPQ